MGPDEQRGAEAPWRLLMILIFLMLALVALDLAALRWGVDTTDGGDRSA